MTDMIDVLESRFHALYMESEALGLEREFLVRLEDNFDLYDYDRAVELYRAGDRP